jgi:UDP-N-acetylmuramoyl-tripeptide--D-alanyl-D-alanine ligase
MTEVWILFGVALLPWAALTVIRLKRFLHILQLEEYLTPQYARWLRENASRYTWQGYSKSLSLFLVLYLLAFLDVDRSSVAGTVFWGALGLFFLVVSVRLARPTKKPLVMTARARRILSVSVSFVVVVVCLTLIFVTDSDYSGLLAGTLLLTLCLFAGHVVLLANLALWPLEERSRRRFQRLASAKLAQQRPRVIAITGSAGKTTTKELVAHLLSARYRVLKTPASFNTPLGVARTVNDSFQGQEFFVVEMAAYKRGEIAKLCALVGGTDISAITTVNAQHLERFGSLEATAAAKWEIVDGLKPGGAAVLNFDVSAVRERAERLSGVEVISFGAESEDVKLRAGGVVETSTGIEFDVTYGREQTHITTRLLARHNVTNVLAALGIGLSCGLDVPYMAAAIRGFLPPDHRLQPVEVNGVTVLDDAYNANPEGIIGAIEVLGRYAPRRRVLVTPGLIEMGKDKETYHARIGKAAAANVDLAFLVGPKQTADIRYAMVAASFPEASLHVTRSLDEARDLLAKIGAKGDVILYANDLPDQFDEFLTI